MTRQNKTPRQRAEEQLAVAERKVTRLEAERTKHQANADTALTELEVAARRRDYLAKSPDLIVTPTTPQENK